MTTQSTDKQAAVKASWTAEGESIALSMLKSTFIPLWGIATYTRVAFAQEVGEPKYWWTALVPLWIVFILYVWEMSALSRATLYSTHKESQGTRDVSWSNRSFALVLVACAAWVGLWVLHKTGASTIAMPLTLSQVSGMAALLIACWSEADVTTKQWAVANRRPGGTIGMA